MLNVTLSGYGIEPCIETAALPQGSGNHARTAAGQGASMGTQGLTEDCAVFWHCGRFDDSVAKHAEESSET
jgi:hypothetical protein